MQQVINWNLMIKNCPNLTSFEGLDALRRVYGEVAIIENEGLTTMSGFGSLEELGGWGRG